MTDADRSLGDAVSELAATIEARRSAHPETSYTAALIAAGPARCAKKFGEEAVEAVVAAAKGDKRELADEAADALYHLLVLLAASGVAPGAVAEALAGRRGVSGHDEKAARADLT